MAATVERTSTPFYVTGGTLPPDASSYVERAADRELLSALLSGEYCYVLNSRQMGKSSLCVRTIGRLTEEGVRTVFLDLTKYGGRNLTAEQWYAALLADAGRELGLRSEFLSWWKEKAELGPMQRFFEALSEVALSSIEGPLVVFVDEIDVTLSLPFPTDEFFAAIRQLYVGRSTRPELSRLTFCLLGTATPADLIQDTRVSPFNIGKRIEVRDFTPEEAAPLASGLGENGSKLLERVLYWTGGHPYLTQRHCRAAAESQARSTADVDRVCTELFLTHTAKESDDNLAFVRNRLLRSEADLAALLDLYRKLRQGGRVQDDETNPLTSNLKLSGVATVEGGTLKVRNRIYEHVFDKAWAVQHMADAELRRQRQAYKRGLIRASVWSALVLSVVGALAIHSTNLAMRATRGESKARAAAAAEADATKRAAAEARESRRNLYVARMRLVQHELESNRFERAKQLLNDERPSPGSAVDLRGFEWRYYWDRCPREIARYDGNGAFAADGKFAAVHYTDGRVRVIDRKTGRDRALIRLLPGAANVDIIAGGRLLWSHESDDRVRLRDIATSRLIFECGIDCGIANDGKGFFRGDPTSDWVTYYEIPSGRVIRRLYREKERPHEAAVSPSGHTLVLGFDDGRIVLADADSGRISTIRTANESLGCVAISPDRSLVAAGLISGGIRIWDAKTTRLLTTLQGHRGLVGHLEFSLAKRLIVSAATDGTQRVWDVITGGLRAIVPATGVGYSKILPGNQILVTGARDFHCGCGKFGPEARGGMRSVAPAKSGISRVPATRTSLRFAAVTHT